MNIYVSHSTSFDYQNELYKPLRESDLNARHEIILPHENTTEPFSSKELFQAGCDLMVAEVSLPSTGQGIELGWADAFGVPILFIHQKDAKLSSSLKTIGEKFLAYENSSEIPSLISSQL